MQYRKFGKLEWQVSALGFGAMRLPLLGPGILNKIDESAAIKMIRYAIDNGVNYIDTAFPYNMGNSERVIGLALRDGYRQKVRVASKLSSQYLKSSQDFDYYLDAQLKRLRTSKLDFYLLHGLNERTWEQFRNWKAIEWVERKIVQGKIDYFGFSFHDNYSVFKKIVDYYDNWTFCQLQYNYVDENSQAGRKGVEYAAAKNMGVVVMEPLRGGQLAKKPPAMAANLWSNVSRRNHIEWAMDWLWTQPEISVVLSGMSTLEQVIENVTFASRSDNNLLKAPDLSNLAKIGELYKATKLIPCTGCQYCQPCPNGVSIPKIFEIYNNIFSSLHSEPATYSGYAALGQEQQAINCKECGECSKSCPQKINIPEELKKAHFALLYREKRRSPIIHSLGSIRQKTITQLGRFLWRFRR